MRTHSLHMSDIPSSQISFPPDTTSEGRNKKKSRDFFSEKEMAPACNTLGFAEEIFFAMTLSRSENGELLLS